MAVKIRLQRHGARNAPVYRLVVADSRRKRDGRFIEILGVYDPRNKIRQQELNIRVDRAHYWISVGAQPSDTARSLIKRAEREHAAEPEAIAVEEVVPAPVAEPTPPAAVPAVEPEAAPVEATAAPVEEAPATVPAEEPEAAPPEATAAPVEEPPAAAPVEPEAPSESPETAPVAQETALSDDDVLAAAMGAFEEESLDEAIAREKEGEKTEPSKDA